MDQSALRDAVSDMDRRKQREEVSFAAKSGLDAASNIGTETPMVVLLDIRKCITDLSETLTENERIEAERESRREERHHELIATLQSMALQVSGTSSMPYRPMSRDSIGSSTDKRQFFHKDTVITTGPQIIGVVLMQLDKVLQNSGQLPEYGSNDAVILDLKGWSSPVSKVAAVGSASTKNRSKIALPKLSQHETASTLEIVASTTQGRIQPFRVSEALTLQQSCPGLIGIVEEIRQRIIRCPGIIPEGRRERLAHFKFPYVTRDGDLNIGRIAHDFVKAGPLVTESLPKMKDAAKKLYVLEVLENGTAPILAYNKAKTIN
jgi:hypothetical protein